MCLNWFLPHRHKTDGSGLLRKLWRSLGASWEYAPARRVIQVACFAVFLLLFFVSARPEPGVAERAWLPPQLFLAADPLATLFASIAGRVLAASVVVTTAVLAVGLFVPRWFCAYACPLGTLIDLFDCVTGPLVRRCHLKRRGWWVNLRYYVLTGVLLAAMLGVTGFILPAPIPLLTRGLLLTLGERPPALQGAALWLALLLIAGVFLVSLLGPRFWCRCLCPTGAVFSLANLLRLTDRRVDQSCIHCGRCVRACRFDAVCSDFATRPLNCTFCQECGGACPTGAIDFVFRSRQNAPVAAQARGAPETCEIGPRKKCVAMSRRGFLGGVVAVIGAVVGFRVLESASEPALLIRPPGSVPEGRFQALCIRCGACIRACASGILQPFGMLYGAHNLWTPHGDPDRAPCDPDCNNCGQICPTGAIRRLTLAEKRAARMGFAIVDDTCIRCGACVEACPYKAIRWTDDDWPELAVMRERCVGCGACQHACFSLNVRPAGRTLERAAIWVHAGKDGDGRMREDRINFGSCRELHLGTNSVVAQTNGQRRQRGKESAKSGEGESVC